MRPQDSCGPPRQLTRRFAGMTTGLVTVSQAFLGRNEFQSDSCMSNHSKSLGLYSAHNYRSKRTFGQAE